MTTPTLPTACGSLPPEGAVSPWERPGGETSHEKKAHSK